MKKPHCQCLHEIENKLPRTKRCMIACQAQHQILYERNAKTSYQKAIELFKTTGLNYHEDDFVELATPEQGKVIDEALKFIKEESLHERQQAIFNLEGSVTQDSIDDYIEILKFERDRMKSFSFEAVCYDISIKNCIQLKQHI